MKWSKEDLLFLKENFSKFKVSELSFILNRTKGSIKRKKGILKLRVVTPKRILKCCLCCNNEFESLISQNAKFCSQRCSGTFNNLKRDKEVYIKNGNKLRGLNKIPPPIKKCTICQSSFEDTSKNKKVKTCSKKCASDSKRINCSIPQKKIAEDINRRIFLRDIGRKGGFGNKGIINGVRYDSNLEKICFQYLIDNKIEFIAHKNIPNSSKISDIYITNNDLYIELDGINREKRKKWLGNDYQFWLNKLDIYKNQGLKLEIFYNFNDFKKYVDANLQ